MEAEYNFESMFQPMDFENNDNDMNSKKGKSCNDDETLMENIAQVMSAADDPVVLEKDGPCYNPATDLSGYHLSTRKGTRSMLAEQSQKETGKFLNELLLKIDEKVHPAIEDDDIGGKWIRSKYCSDVYSIKCLIFHLTPNRSVDYLEDFKEISGYVPKCLTNHKIVSAVLDAPCVNLDGCWYKTLFFPHVRKPGPILLPEVIRDILEVKRHGLSLSAATDLIDLLCSYVAPMLNDLDLKTESGEKITSSSIEYQSEINFEPNYDFDHVKWGHGICICCLFMKQVKIPLQAGSGNWIRHDSGSGCTSDDPLDVITLIGYESHIDQNNMQPDINCLSNCININGYNVTRFIKSHLNFFQRYKIEPIECFRTQPRYQVSLKEKNEL